jgi:hypothetical protein
MAQRIANQDSSHLDISRAAVDQASPAFPFEAVTSWVRTVERTDLSHLGPAGNIRHSECALKIRSG